MGTHVKVVAGLFIACGVLGLLAAALAGAAFSAFAGLAGASGEDGAALGMAILGLTGMALAAVLLLFSVPCLICGWGLLKFRRWARVLAIVLAALALVQFPTGTVFGAYALWVLFQKEAERLFDAPAGLA